MIICYMQVIICKLLYASCYIQGQKYIISFTSQNFLSLFQNKSYNPP